MRGGATLLDHRVSQGRRTGRWGNVANRTGGDGGRWNDLNVGWVLPEREHAMQVAEGQPPDWHERLPAVFAPSGRLLRPEEVAAAAVYLLAEESGPVNGAVIELEQYSLHGRNPGKV